MTPYEKYVTFPDSLNRTVSDWAAKDLSQDRWTNGIADIVGVEGLSFSTNAEARKAFLYSLEYLYSGETNEPAVIWESIIAKVKTLGRKYPWALRDEDEFVDSALAPKKEVKPKRKTGLDCAINWWKENLTNLSGMKPNAIQKQMAKECNLHLNSCRGTYYRLKKEMPIPA